MKLSKWIDGKKFKPAHVGVWEVYFSENRTMYQYWNGRFMGGYGYCVIEAFNNRKFESIFQDLNFRGLAEKP